MNASSSNYMNRQSRRANSHPVSFWRGLRSKPLAFFALGWSVPRHPKRSNHHASLTGRLRGLLAVMFSIYWSLSVPAQAQDPLPQGDSTSSNWISRSSGTTQSLSGVTYGNGSFVAVGANGTVLTSPDGVIWINRASGTTNWLRGVTYANGTFVAVGTIGTILTSPDGVNWISRTSGTTNPLTGVTYGNGSFVAVGTNGTILTSSDGAIWTNRNFNTVWLDGVTYGDGTFVAVGWIGLILTSPDGVNWTYRRGSTSLSGLHAVTYGSGTFVAVGTQRAIVTSPDGVNWTTGTAANNPRLNGVTYGSSSFVAVGSGGAILTSPDGGTWTNRGSGTTNDLHGVTNANGGFVAVGASGTILQTYPLSLTLDPSKPLYKLEEEFTAEIRVVHTEEEPATYTFPNGVLRELGDASILTLGEVEVEDEFVLGGEDRERVFLVPVVASGRGSATLETQVLRTAGNGAVTILRAEVSLVVNPFDITLSAKPVKNVFLDDEGNVIDPEGNPVSPKVEVKIENKSDEFVTATVQGVDPHARDLSPELGRVEVTGEFPLDLGTIAAGDSVTHEFDIEIHADGRFEFDALISGVLVGGTQFNTSERGARLVVGPDGEVTLRRPDANGLSEASIGAGRTSIDEPLVFKTDPAILETMPEVSKGLVADGVTPLLFEIKTPSRADSSDDEPVEYTLELELVEGGSLGGPPAADRLRVAKEGQWTTEPTITFTASDTKHYACFTPVLSDEVQLAGPARQLTMRLLVINPENDAVVGEGEFFLRKPPIALVHGYNTDGGWGDLFSGILGTSRSRFIDGEEDFIRTVRYGQLPAWAGDTEKENTVLPFANLAPMLLQKLNDLKQDLENDWALTRYDVVAHSQGGVLARILCSQNSNSHVPLPFRNEENFNRGRFHRVVTIGSPHNGTRIVRYMAALRDRFVSSSTNRVSLGLSGQVAALMIWNGTAQLKFDPIGEQIKLINRSDAGAPWLPDPGAKFHLVQTTVNSGMSPAPDAYSYSDAALGLNATGHMVLPRGSDGVVDFDSMGSTTPEAGQNTPTNVFRLPSEDQISHAFVDPSGKSLDLGLGVDLFGGSSGQVLSSEVAWHVIGVLDQKEELPAADRVFGPFRLPAPITQAVIDSIQTAAEAVTPGVDAIQIVTGSQTQSLSATGFDAKGNGSTPMEFEFALPEGEDFTGSVLWAVERYGIGGVSTHGISLEPVAGDPSRISISVDENIPGDVVLYGTATTTSGKVIIGVPVLVFSAEPDPGVYSLSSFEILPAEGEFAAGTGVEPNLIALYTLDSSPGDAPLRIRRWIDPSDFAVSSSNPAAVDVTDPLEWNFVSAGSATLSVDWRGLGAPATLTVYDDHPGRGIDAFNSWAINLGLPENSRGLTVRNGPLEIENLLAFALGIDPFEATPSDLPALSHDPDQRHLMGLTYTRSKSVSDNVLYEIQDSRTLQGWEPAELVSHTKTGETASDEIWEAIFDITTESARFVRLRINLK